MERERITISIKKDLLNRIDKFIDGTNIRNRSNAVEVLATKGLGQEATKKAVVLLGGKDALKSITGTKIFLSQLKSVGFDHVHIAVGFLADKIKERLGDGSEFDMKFTYSDKGEGSGGAILSLKKQLTETFIVYNSDKGYEIDLKFLLDYHRNHNTDATIATDDLENMTGIYVFEPNIISVIRRGFSMIEEDLIPELLKQGRTIFYPIAS